MQTTFTQRTVLHKKDTMYFPHLVIRQVSLWALLLPPHICILYHKVSARYSLENPGAKNNYLHCTNKQKKKKWRDSYSAQIGNFGENNMSDEKGFKVASCLPFLLKHLRHSFHLFISGGFSQHSMYAGMYVKARRQRVEVSFLLPRRFQAYNSGHLAFQPVPSSLSHHTSLPSSFQKEFPALLFLHQGNIAYWYKMILQKQNEIHFQHY